MLFLSHFSICSSSAIYDFIRPSQSVDSELGNVKAVEDSEQNGHDSNRGIKRRSTIGSSNNRVVHNQPLPLEEQGSDTDQEALKENPFNHRSKSHIFSRGSKIQGNPNPCKMQPSLQQEKKERIYTIAAFATLPRKVGKKKKSKGNGRSDQVYVTGPSEPPVNFEQYWQYSEDNPPPLPPRPHELPPLQSVRSSTQLSLSVDASGLMMSNVRKALEASRRIGSVDPLPSCDWEDESNLDMVKNGSGAAREDASPYEVPVALREAAMRQAEAPQSNPVYTQVKKVTPERDTTDLTSTMQHASFKQPTSADDTVIHKIGLRRLIHAEPPSHPPVSPFTSKTAVAAPGKPHFQRHRRCGSYDPSLLKSVKAVEPPTLPHLSQQYLARSMASIRPQLPPWTGRGRFHGTGHITPHLDGEVRGLSTSPVQNTSMHPNISVRFPLPQPSMPDAPLESVHSRQSSLPDSLNYGASSGDSGSLPLRPHQPPSFSTSGPAALDHSKRTHTLLPGMAISSRLTTQVRSSLKSSSECLGSEIGPSPRSSEEREYTMAPRGSRENVFAFPREERRDFRQKRRSTHSDGSNLYEQIDDNDVQRILGHSEVPSPFPQPLLLSEANLDADALREIQRWHAEFMQVYSHWMRSLDSILRRSEQRSAAADRKEERLCGSHKDSGISTSLSRENLASPSDAPTPKAPPPSAAVNLAKTPNPTGQSSAVDSQPSHLVEPVATTETALSDDTTLPPPSSPLKVFSGDPQEPVVHRKPSADSDTADKYSQGQQCSENTGHESERQHQEVAGDSEQMHSIKITSQSEQEVVCSERTATYVSNHHHQPQYETSAGHVVQQCLETVAAPCGQQREQLAIVGEHAAGYNHLIGLRLQNGGSLHPPLPSPRKVSLV